MRVLYANRFEHDENEFGKVICRNMSRVDGRTFDRLLDCMLLEGAIWHELGSTGKDQFRALAKEEAARIRKQCSGLIETYDKKRKEFQKRKEDVAKAKQELEDKENERQDKENERQALVADFQKKVNAVKSLFRCVSDTARLREAAKGFDEVTSDARINKLKPMTNEEKGRLQEVIDEFQTRVNKRKSTSMWKPYLEKLKSVLRLM